MVLVITLYIILLTSYEDHVTDKQLTIGDNKLEANVYCF